MALPEFIAFLKAHRLSQKTIRNYASDVSQFLTWAESRTLDSEIFIAYKHHLQAQNTPLATLNRHLSALRQFSSFLKINLSLDNAPLPLIPTVVKNFRSHLVKNRYKHKTIANYLSDVRHYLTWIENHV